LLWRFSKFWSNEKLWLLIAAVPKYNIKIKGITAYNLGCSQKNENPFRALHNLTMFYETFEKPGDFHHHQKDDGLF
jgi:hypothetical protein